MSEVPLYSTAEGHPTESQTAPPYGWHEFPLRLDCRSGSLLNTQGLGAQLARALHTETHVESGTSQSKLGTSVNLSDSGILRTLLIPGTLLAFVGWSVCGNGRPLFDSRF